MLVIFARYEWINVCVGGSIVLYSEHEQFKYKNINYFAEIHLTSDALKTIFNFRAEEMNSETESRKNCKFNKQ